MTNHQIIFRENKLYSIYSSQLQLLFHQPYFYISCLVLLPCISTWLCRDTTEPAKNPEGEKKKRCVMYVGVGSSPSFSSPFFLLPYTMKNHLLATFQAHIQSCMLGNQYWMQRGRCKSLWKQPRSLWLIRNECIGKNCTYKIDFVPKK